MPNAAVLPLPVLACCTRSRRCRIGGGLCCWIGVICRSKVVEIGQDGWRQRQAGKRKVAAHGKSPAGEKAPSIHPGCKPLWARPAGVCKPHPERSAGRRSASMWQINAATSKIRGFTAVAVAHESNAALTDSPVRLSAANRPARTPGAGGAACRNREQPHGEMQIAPSRAS